MAKYIQSKHSWESIKLRSWHGTYTFHNNIVKKEVLRKVNKIIRYDYFFLKHYVDSFSSTVDLPYIAIHEMSDDKLIPLCKYLCDRDNYLAFSSSAKYKTFLRKINVEIEKIYEETLYELLVFYGVGLVTTIFVCVIALLNV